MYSVSTGPTVGFGTAYSLYEAFRIAFGQNLCCATSYKEHSLKGLVTECEQIPKTRRMFSTTVVANLLYLCCQTLVVLLFCSCN